jgi:hypothetical protein
MPLRQASRTAAPVSKLTSRIGALSMAEVAALVSEVTFVAILLVLSYATRLVKNRMEEVETRVKEFVVEVELSNFNSAS